MDYEEKRKRIAECLLGLFGIMTAESQARFAEALKAVGTEGTVSDIVRGADFIQMLHLVRTVVESQFTQDPRPFVGSIKEMLKPDEEEKRRKAEEFVNNIMPPLF